MNNIETKKNIESTLYRLTEDIIDYLLLILLFPNNSTKWLKQLYNICNHIPIIKETGKLPSYKWILNNSFNVWEDSFYDHVDNRINDLVYSNNTYNSEILEKPENYNSYALYNGAEEYFKWLAYNLSIYGSIDLQDMIQEINTIKVNYNKLIESYKTIKLEMAKYFKDIMEDINSYIPVICEHFILCCLYLPQTPTTRLHWEEDIYKAIRDIPKVKGKNKFPDAEDMMKQSIKEIEKHINTKLEQQIKSLANKVDKYSKKRLKEVTTYDKSKLHDVIIEYYTWLYSELSQNGYVSREMVAKKVDELIGEYNNSIK